jgi:hypothetical protein
LRLIEWRYQLSLPENCARSDLLRVFVAFSLSLTGRTSAFKDVKNLSHQFQACEVIFHDKEFQWCHTLILF